MSAGGGLSAFMPDETELPEIAMRILRVAMEIFTRKGFAATSVREIAAAAEVTNPMLYYYFKNKEGVFQRLLSLMMTGMGGRMRAALEAGEGRPIGERLRMLLDVHFDAVCRSPGPLRFFYTVLFGPPECNPVLPQPEGVGSGVELVRSMLEGAIASGEFTPSADFDAQFLADQFFSLIWGHSMQALELSLHPPGSCRPSPADDLFGEPERRRLISFYCTAAGISNTETLS